MLHLWNPEDDAKLEAIYRSQIVAEFATDGTILAANSNFLAAFGYGLSEIVHRKHSMLVEESYGLSQEYAGLWADLRNGQAKAIECQRITKGGQRLWLQATYTPITNRRGQVQKIVKFATDVTTDALRNLDYEGQIEALNRSQAIAEFSLDGKILYANENFLQAFGYSWWEVVGRHHRVLVDDATAASEDYSLFWRDLAAGRYQAAEYQRVGKNGREVFIQASYNPIKDRNGATIKILKMATDVTSEVRERRQRAHLQEVLQRGLDAISNAFENVAHQAEGATNPPRRQQATSTR